MSLCSTLNATVAAGNLVVLWTADTSGCIPRTVVFTDQGRLLNIYCLENGEMYVDSIICIAKSESGLCLGSISRDCETAEKKHPRSLQSPMYVHFP
jgi:hypothetical protein